MIEAPPRTGGSVAWRASTLVDALDRVLEKGLFLDADLIITVADVPLIAARLKVLLASVETMIAQGFMAERWLPIRPVGAVTGAGGTVIPGGQTGPGESRQQLAGKAIAPLVVTGALTAKETP